MADVVSLEALSAELRVNRALCQRRARAGGRAIDRDAIGHQCEGVVEGLDALFQIEHGHIQEVELGFVDALHGVDYGEFEVGEQILELGWHIGGVPEPMSVQPLIVRSRLPFGCVRGRGAKLAKLIEHDRRDRS
jgi:hypothetical protein